MHRAGRAGRLPAPAAACAALLPLPLCPECPPLPPFPAQLTWVQPRVLTMPQMEGLRGRLDGWLDKVNAAAAVIEEEAVGVVVQA